jgi:YesN/AraC family two-component response regulator
MAVSSPHILAVDDEASTREALTAALDTTYVVQTAATGGEACAILRAHPVAAIILDAVLAAEHGLDLVAPFRLLSPAPILLLTGHGSEELAGRAVWVGVNGYLKKPVSIPVLSGALKRLLPQAGGPAALGARARQYLDAYFAKPLRTADVADQFGVSEMHLRRCFRATCGKTPRRCLTEVRMQQAARLLGMTALGVEQVAGEVGYPSSTTFGRVFRRRFGVSPSEYRTNPGGAAGREQRGNRNDTKRSP